MLLRRVAINAFIESMKKNGPVSFSKRKDGKSKARKVDELKNDHQTRHSGACALS